MATLAQEMIAEYYGKPVGPSFVAEEHLAGTLNAAQQKLYWALVGAGQVPQLQFTA